MKHYKIISRYAVQEYTKPYVYVEGRQVSYPSAEVLAMAGIKPLTIEAEPEYDATKQYTTPYYEEGEECILQKWEVFDIPEGVIEDESVADA